MPTSDSKFKPFEKLKETELFFWFGLLLISKHETSNIFKQLTFTDIQPLHLLQDYKI